MWTFYICMNADDINLFQIDEYLTKRKMKVKRKCKSIHRYLNQTESRKAREFKQFQITVATYLSALVIP